MKKKSPFGKTRWIEIREVVEKEGDEQFFTEYGYEHAELDSAEDTMRMVAEHVSPGTVISFTVREMKNWEYNKKHVIGTIWGDHEGVVVDENCPKCEHLLIFDDSHEGKYCSNHDCGYIDEDYEKNAFKPRDKDNKGRTLYVNEPVEEFAKKHGIELFDRKRGEKCVKCKTHDVKYTKCGITKTGDGSSYAFVAGECICKNKYSIAVPFNDSAKNFWRGII